MIIASELITGLVAALDAEGSQRYSFDRDYKPAINYAIDYYVSAFNFAFGMKKLSEENLRELTRTRVWQTSKYSRIHFDPADIGEEVWSLLVVAPEPTLDPQIAPLDNPSPEESMFIPTEDTTFVRSEYSAGRQTFEEWNQSFNNVFMPGNVTLNNKFKTYAYKNFTHFNPGELANEIISEIEVRPYLDNQLVGVTYIVYPPKITATDSTVFFPKTMMNLMTSKALQFISWKQGDQTNLFSVSQKDVQDLVNLMS